jgi:D-inositol-3-phosphate glycosyltransferase
MDLADCVIAANSVERDHMLSQYRIDPAKIAIAPLGVDTSLFAPRDRARARERLGLAGKQVVFSVGRIEPLKGMDTLVRAAALLRDQEPEVRERLQVLIGGGQVDDDDPSGGVEVAHLQRLVDELGLTEHVRLMGAVPQDALPDYYAAAQCVVVPSHYESFGLVALEAMACGTPVVASRVGGLSLTVKDGETGFLVPPRDDAAFAQRISRLLRSPELVARMGATAAAVARGYSWRAVADRVLGLYDRFGVVCRAPARSPAESRRYATTCGCSA